LYTRRLHSLLRKAGLIGDQDTVRSGQRLGNIRAQTITQLVSVPPRPVQEMLQPARIHRPSSFGQLPTVLALHRRQQPRQIRPRPTPRLRTIEHPRHPREHLIETSPPCRNIFRSNITQHEPTSYRMINPTAKQRNTTVALGLVGDQYMLGGHDRIARRRVYVIIVPVHHRREHGREIL